MARSASTVRGKKAHFNFKKYFEFKGKLKKKKATCLICVNEPWKWDRILQPDTRSLMHHLKVWHSKIFNQWFSGDEALAVSIRKIVKTLMNSEKYY